MQPATPTSATTYSLIFGLGATGLSVLRHLAGSGRALWVVDNQPAPAAWAEAVRIAPNARFSLGSVDDSVVLGAGEIILSPGVPRSLPVLQAAAQRGTDIYGDIELFARSAPEAKVMAITGSNGKSTTTSLVAALLKASGHRVAAGGNLAPPALDLLQHAETEWYVLELSSFQLESTWSLRPQSAVVLNLSEDHLDRYPSMADYAAAKAGIYALASRRVVNRDDPWVRGMLPKETATIGFSLDADTAAGFCAVPQADGETWVVCEGMPLIPAAAIRIKGRHNLANVLAALALTWPWLDDYAAIRAVLAEFAGLPHRLTLVATAAGIDWLNDSKATNVGAAVAAIVGLRPRPLIVIAGGQAKGQDFRPLAAALGTGVKALILLGVDADLIAEVCAGLLPIHRVASMQAAVDCAAQLAEPGDAVLLSPACASLDMFANYAARGDAFSAAVHTRLAA